jgi:metal-sulfur cluster biosynthetic enzyme
VQGIAAVEVELTYDPPWMPQMMGIEAKIHFGIAD